MKDGVIIFLILAAALVTINIAFVIDDANKRHTENEKIKLQIELKKLENTEAEK